jgi:hypothetical protein
MPLSDVKTRLPAPHNKTDTSPEPTFPCPTRHDLSYCNAMHPQRFKTPATAMRKSVRFAGFYGFHCVTFVTFDTHQPAPASRT